MVASWIFYTAKVQALRFGTGSHQQTVYELDDLSVEHEVTWICGELFLSAVLLMDVLVHLVCAPANSTWKHTWTYYNIVDVVAFSCLVLPNVMTTKAFGELDSPCVA